MKINKNLIIESVLQNIKNSYLGIEQEDSGLSDNSNNSDNSDNSKTNVQSDTPTNNFTGLKSSTTYNANHLVNDAQSVIEHANKSIGKDYENK